MGVLIRLDDRLTSHELVDRADRTRECIEELADREFAAIDAMLYDQASDRAGECIEALDALERRLRAAKAAGEEVSDTTKAQLCFTRVLVLNSPFPREEPW
jgi:hypothetical protein